MPSLTDADNTAAANNNKSNGGSSDAAKMKAANAAAVTAPVAADPTSSGSSGLDASTPLGQAMMVVDKKVRNLEKRKVSHPWLALSRVFLVGDNRCNERSRL